MDFTSVESSAISGYHYDPNSKVLSVKFNSGAAYEYTDVPPQTVQIVFNPESSIGAKFGRLIRNIFQHRKI